MRTKVKFDGVWLRPVPWLAEGDCDGCYVNSISTNCDFNCAANENPCDDGREFSGMILIRNTKEAMAEYVAKKITGDLE